MTLRVLTLSASFALVTALGVACSADGGGPGGGNDNGGTDTGSDLGGDGIGIDNDGISADSDGIGPDGGGPDGGGCGKSLTAIVRDFKAINNDGHPDFELAGRGVENTDGTAFKGWNESGCDLVLPALGADRKPAFNGTPVTVPGRGDLVGYGGRWRTVQGPGCYTSANPNPTGECFVGTCGPFPDYAPPSPTITSAASFSDWYNTKDGVNKEIEVTLELPETAPGSGIRLYDTNAFFPIDGQGFGNTPGQAHNFHFTTEIHVKFKYEAGQKFSFRGDDDLWIFVNGKIALDVGGAHQALNGTIDFDAKAAELGITVGQEYNMDIFHAERQTTESNFRIETNISCFVPAPILK